jgi:hypothetical protein
MVQLDDTWGIKARNACMYTGGRCDVHGLIICTSSERMDQRINGRMVRMTGMVRMYVRVNAMRNE